MTKQYLDADKGWAPSRPQSDRHPVDLSRVIAQHEQHEQLKALCGRLEACADDLLDSSAVIGALIVVAELNQCLPGHELLDVSILGGDLNSENALTTQVLLEQTRYCHVSVESQSGMASDRMNQNAKSLRQTRNLGRWSDAGPWSFFVAGRQPACPKKNA